MSMSDVFKNLSGKILIDGQYIESKSGERIPIIDPSSESTIGEIAETSMMEIDQATKAASKAQKGWWRLSALERAETMHDIANELHGRKAELAEALTREMGKPYKESADEVDWSVSAIRYYAEIGRSDVGKVIGNAVEGHFNYTLKLPLGTVVSIQPFNYPMTLLAWEGAAALICGNAVIVKPSEFTSITTLLFAETFNRHLPDGLFQVVTGAGAAGKALVEHAEHTHGCVYW